MPRLEIDAAALERVVLLTVAMRSLRVLSRKEIAQRADRGRYARRMEADARGVLWVPLPPPVKQMVNAEWGGFRAFLRSVDNDLAEQVRIVSGIVSQFYSTGLQPAPYYAERIAIILRKGRQWDLESKFLEQWVRLFRDNIGCSSWFVDRAEKASRLAMRAARDKT